MKLSVTQMKMIQMDAIMIMMNYLMSRQAYHHGKYRGCWRLHS